MPADAPPVQEAPPPAAAPPTPDAGRQAINVSELPKGEAPAPVKPGSARARMSEELHKKFSGDPPNSPEAPKGKSTAAAKPADDASPEAPSPEGGAPTEAAPPSQADPKAGKPGKVSPWKLVDDYKARLTAAETRAAELEKRVIPEDKAKAEQARIAEMDKRMREMVDDLRYHNAEKYDPDVQKVQADYDRAWQRAMSELNEITLTDPNTQQVRAVTASDLLELVNLPLGKAREIADAAFGAFADDVMLHRKEIRTIFDSKAAKLEELKKNGAEREQQRISAFQTAQQQAQKLVQETFQKANAEALADQRHGHLFKPREGDEEWNKRLETGFKLVDEAFSKNAYLPNLTPEERQNIVRKQAAIRNRAASWGPLRYENESLKAKLAALEKKMKSYEESTPPTEGRSAPATPSPASGMSGMLSDLRKLAK
jgi:hypothetical protein